MEEVVDGLLLEMRLGEARKREVLLGKSVEGIDLVADRRDQSGRLVHLGFRATPHNVLQDLGVQLDGADGIAHLVGDLEREPAHRGHALGHEQLLLCGLQSVEGPCQLVVEALDLTPRPALAVGHESQGHGG